MTRGVTFDRPSCVSALFSGRSIVVDDRLAVFQPRYHRVPGSRSTDRIITCCVSKILRSPPRTRRSSTSSTGSSGNGGYSGGGGLNLTSGVGGGLATARRASRRRPSRSPSPRPSASATKLNAPVDAGRRSRSPTPRASGDRLTVQYQQQNGTGGSRSRSVTPCRKRKQRSASPAGCGGLLQVPDAPAKTLSNFASELAAEVGDRLSGYSSVDAPQRCGGDDDQAITVDTSSTCRVSDNFRGTDQYRVLNSTPVTAIERRHSTVREEDPVVAEVDTTPFCRVSDSLRAVADYDCPPTAAGHRKKSSSSSSSSHGPDPGTDAKKSQAEPVGTDSGSEVSDEGYKSLGVVVASPAAVRSNAQKLLVNGKHAEKRVSLSKPLTPYPLFSVRRQSLTIRKQMPFPRVAKAFSSF